ncbi:MAG: hypothetical protein NXH78_04250 [Hyphomonadaceae bacterium]|nr:hypothetical protein [Hyphomonadaceae bacterium]
MAQFPALAAFSRSIGYVSGLRIKDKQLVVPQPRVRVSLDRSFFKSLSSALQLYTYLVGVGVSRIFKRNRDRRSIAFYPHNAPPWYNVWLATQVGDIEIVSDIDKADTVFVFEDETFSRTARQLSAEQRSRAFNDRAEDISKSHVARVFEHVFGYSLAVDPLTYEGPAVCKSDANGTHDGKIVQCPISRGEIEEGAVYQRLIETAVDGQRSEDLRTNVVKGALPVVFHKFKTLEGRFGTSYLRTDVRSANDVYSKEEQHQIGAFCREMGLDFGCIDVLRDVSDGRIYIVDVNKTCMPVLSLSFKEQLKALRLMGGALRAAM